MLTTFIQIYIEITIMGLQKDCNAFQVMANWFCPQKKVKTILIQYHSSMKELYIQLYIVYIVMYNRKYESLGDHSFSSFTSY